MKLYAVFWLLLGARSVAEYNHTSNASSSLACHQKEAVPVCSTTNSSLVCTSPWQYCDEGMCKCGQIPKHAILQCKAGKNLSVKDGYCVTMKEDKNKVGYSTFIGQCAYLNFYYHYQKLSPSSAPHELDKFACEQHFNRTGILCGDCKEDHYPLVYSFDMNCVKCSNKFFNVFKLIMAVFLPLTFFYFIVVLFNINVSSSYLTGYVLCCQGMAMPTIARMIILQTLQHKTLQTMTRVIWPLFSIWNLDIFRFQKLHICLGTDSLQTLALDLVVGIYPLLLIILSYLLIQLYDNNFKLLVIAWKPFKMFLGIFHKNWKVKTSLIDAFSTFIFLSNMKFLNVSLDLLMPVHVHQLNSKGNLINSLRLYYDATVPYFGERHLPYAVVAIVMLIIFGIIPALLQILYPFRWFQKLLNVFPFRWYVLHTFMDIFQGRYKDGTEPGTRDYRWFASSFFLLRFFGMIIGVLTPNIAYFPLASILLTITAILFIVVQPYKSSVAHYSSVNAIFLLLLAVWYTSLTGYYQVWMRQNNLMTIPFEVINVLTAIVTILYLSAIILKWMWSQREFGVAVMKRFQARSHGIVELRLTQTLLTYQNLEYKNISF